MLKLVSRYVSRAVGQLLLRSLVTSEGCKLEQCGSERFLRNVRIEKIMRSKTGFQEQNVTIEQQLREIASRNW
jgi:hypothetical protein